MFTAETWPVAANMLSFGAQAPDGGHIKDAPASVWASQLRQVKALGIDQIDPTDAWVPLASLTDARVEELRTVLDGEGLSIPSISMTRNSVVDVENGEKNLADASEVRVHQLPAGDPPGARAGVLRAFLLRALRIRLPGRHRREPRVHPTGPALR